jgi:hypothetical protein
MSHCLTSIQLGSLLYLAVGLSYATYGVTAAVRDWANELSTTQRFALSYYWLPAGVGFFVAWLCWPYALYLFLRE